MPYSFLCPPCLREHILFQHDGDDDDDEVDVDGAQFIFWHMIIQIIVGWNITKKVEKKMNTGGMEGENDEKIMSTI